MQDISEKFYNYFVGISDLISFNTYDDYSLAFMPQNPTLICQYPYQRISISWSGEIPLCISDWSLTTPIGDLRMQTIKEVWQGEKMNYYRQLQKNGRRMELDCCKRCHRLAVPQIGDKPAGKH